MNREQLLKIGKNLFGGGKNGMFFILVVVFIASYIFVDGFFTQANVTNVLRQITVVTILALGATFVIILGHINVAYGMAFKRSRCIALIAGENSAGLRRRKKIKFF